MLIYVMPRPRNIPCVLGIISFLDFVVVHLVGRVTLHDASCLRVCPSNCTSHFHSAVLPSKRCGNRLGKGLTMLSNVRYTIKKSFLLSSYICWVESTGYLQPCMIHNVKMTDDHQEKLCRNRVQLNRGSR